MPNLNQKSREKLKALLYLLAYVISFIWLAHNHNPNVIAFNRIFLPFFCIFVICLNISYFIKTKSLIIKIGYLCVWQYENTIFGHLKYKFPYVIASTIFT